jgi:hypothetical protein
VARGRWSNLECADWCTCGHDVVSHIQLGAHTWQHTVLTTYSSSIFAFKWTHFGTCFCSAEYIKKHTHVLHVQMRGHTIVL